MDASNYFSHDSNKRRLVFTREVQQMIVPLYSSQITIFACLLQDLSLNISVLALSSRTDISHQNSFNIVLHESTHK